MSPISSTLHLKSRAVYTSLGYIIITLHFPAHAVEPKASIIFNQFHPPLPRISTRDLVAMKMWVPGFITHNNKSGQFVYTNVYTCTCIHMYVHAGFFVYTTPCVAIIPHTESKTWIYCIMLSTIAIPISKYYHNLYIIEWLTDTCIYLCMYVNAMVVYEYVYLYRFCDVLCGSSRGSTASESECVYIYILCSTSILSV